MQRVKSLARRQVFQQWAFHVKHRADDVLVEPPAKLDVGRLLQPANLNDALPTPCDSHVPGTMILRSFGHGSLCWRMLKN